MEFPWGNLIGGIVGIVAVVIGSRLTYARSSKEKIWDLRRAAYSVILSELAAIERICDDADEYIDQRGFVEYFEHKAFVNNREEMAKHMAFVRDRVSDDYLILSDAFIKIYDELTHEMQSDPYNSLPPDEHEAFAAAIRKHRPRLKALARSEMTAHNRWWSIF
jgi:hypothetical protein